MRRAGSADRRLADADRSGDGGYHHAGGACGAARRAAVRACRRAAWRGRYRRIAAADGPGLGAGRSAAAIDRKSTRLNSITHAHLVCRLLLEKKKKQSKSTHQIMM